MISVIIPSYKNREMLLRNLAINLKFLDGCEVIVVNDYPPESLKEDFKELKKVKLIENEKNLGFGGAVNKGVEKATGEYIILLNSDVILTSPDFQKAVDYFKKDPSLFAMTFMQSEREDQKVGKNSIYWSGGFFHHRKAGDLLFGECAWAEGGAGIFDKKKFLELKGFDLLYSPFYWEDIDLSYRAWKKGYKVLFLPDVLVKHYHESTIGKYFSKDQITKIVFRNQLIFIWKNITDFSLMLNHIVLLPINLFAPLLEGNTVFLIGFLNALVSLPKILKFRKKQKKYFIMSDTKILDKFNG